MAGRYSLTRITSDIDLPEEASASLSSNWKPRYNIAPGQEAWILRAAQAGETREAALLRWGLVPSWARKPASARNSLPWEATLSDPAAQAAYQRRRCVVLADGFYLWKTKHPISQAYYFQLESKNTFLMAGIWEYWSEPEGYAFESFALLTVPSRGQATKCSGRMPALLQNEAVDAWLEGALPAEASESEYSKLMQADKLASWPVGHYINDSLSDAPKCCKPLPKVERAQLDLKLIK